MKRTFKQSFSSLLGGVFAGDQRSRVVVLCYHSIHPTLPFASATPELFRDHLSFLQETCDVVPLSDVNRVAAGPRRSRAAVALTFDDGYRDNYTHALPLLDEMGMPATFFLTVGLVERDPDVVARLTSIRRTTQAAVTAVTWQEARELVAAGHDVGSHTWSHPILARLDAESAREELVRAKNVLEHNLGTPVTSFAYPFGKPGAHFTRETTELVRDAGYRVAAAVIARGVRRRDSELAIPRFFATRDSVETLAAKVAGRWDWLGLWQEHTPRWLSKAVSPADYRDPAENLPAELTPR